MKSQSITTFAEDIPISMIGKKDNYKKAEFLAPLTYEYTTNKALLEQYYQIREECYREGLGLENFSGAEDEYDRIGHIAIARRGNKVIGGIRLTVSTPDSTVRLPLEEEGFMMKDIFPELGLPKLNYCEITRLAVIPTFRVGDTSKELIRLMLQKAIVENCAYQFSVAPLIQARNYRMLIKQIGFLPIIRTDIEVPEKAIYEHLNYGKMCVSITSLRTEMAKASYATAKIAKNLQTEKVLEDA